MLRKVLKVARSWDLLLTKEVWDRNVQLVSVKCDLGSKSRGAVGTTVLRSRASQCCAVADTVMEIHVLISHLGQHPVPQQPKELIELDPLKQVEKGGIAGYLG